MIKQFLHEMIREVLDGDNREIALKQKIAQSKQFADFIDVTYNLNYNWEFDSNYNKKAKNNRERGGLAGEWYEVIRLIRRSLLSVNNESPNFTKRLDRALELCNQNDIKIILCSLKKRSIQYIDTKKVYEWFPEYLKKDS